MASVTPVVVPGEGYVRVEVDWRSFPSVRKCWIHRRLAPFTTSVRLREGNAVRVSGGIAVAYDHEMPLDELVLYRSVAALNANGDFEEGVTEWTNTANNGTAGVVSQSFDYYVPGEGVASLRLDTPGGIAAPKAVSEFVPATAGTTYTIEGRLMVLDYWSGGIGVQIQWYNGTSLLSTVGATNDFAPFPGEWGTYGFSAVAPATTTHARLVASIAGTPPSTVSLFVDEIFMTTSGMAIEAPEKVIVPSRGAGWWTDPLHPATKVRLQVDLQLRDCRGDVGVAYLGVGADSHPADSSALEVNDSPDPIGVWNVRKSLSSSVTVATATEADRLNVEALHASGAPLLLQMSSVYGVPVGLYGLHGDVDWVRISGDQRNPIRVTSSPYRRVLAPVGPPEGTLRTRYMDLTRYSTFRDAAAGGGGAWDDYGRTVGAGSWGSTPNVPSLAWTIDGTASNASVNGTGVLANSVLNTLMRARLAALNLGDVRVKVNSIVSVAPVGSYIRSEVIARYVDANNMYIFRVHRAVGGAIDLQIIRVLAGVETVLAALTSTVTATAGVALSMLFEIVGTALRAKIWTATAVEPLAFEISSTDASFASGQVGLAALLPPANSNTLPVNNAFDNLEVTNLAIGGGATWLDGLQGELTL